MTQLKLVIAEHFAGEIWRMEIDSVSHIIFIETRSKEDRKVSFASLDLSTGKTHFKDYTVDESWLTGIESAFNGVLLLHYYQATGSPAHKGLAAIQAHSGDLLWNNFNYTFDHLTINGPVVFDSRFQPPVLKLVDINTGNLARSYQPSIDELPDNHILLPKSTSWNDSLPELPAEPYRNILHYLEYNNLIIVSLHALWAGQLRQCLYVLQNKQLIFEDILNTNIQKLQPEAFVLYRNQLIYIKDKVEIKVLNL
ncbi:DUF4905 domain-containing protein [Mucilaginibacter sp. CSA2-8R]|uniref:DUF4905 domain-containing protein n=1 Tax=Mucilaginibacter sp. CSA2-8R TaxID=3141542 RepID=UPI00315DEDC9